MTNCVNTGLLLAQIPEKHGSGQTCSLQSRSDGFKGFRTIAWSVKAGEAPNTYQPRPPEQDRGVLTTATPSNHTIIVEHCCSCHLTSLNTKLFQRNTRTGCWQILVALSSQTPSELPHDWLVFQTSKQQQVSHTQLVPSSLLHPGRGRFHHIEMNAQPVPSGNLL